MSEPNKNTKFKELNLTKETYKAIKNVGFKYMTEIQAEVLPKALDGTDIVATAKTGSGKTLSFLIPAVELVSKLLNEAPSTYCIIVSPTRELATQTYNVLQDLICFHEGITSALIIGGENRKAQSILLADNVHIVVATPGRLFDHMRTKEFDYKNVSCLILDEADKIFQYGFEEDLKQIINRLPKNRQTMLFSATLSDTTEALIKSAMKEDYYSINTDEDNDRATVEGLKQGYAICETEYRLHWLHKLLKKTLNQKIMVFFSSCKSVVFHHEFLSKYYNMSVLCIHGKMNQADRTSVISEFYCADKMALFCTDLAARGLDIPAVDWIVQFDPPADTNEYIHRVGRTARGLGAEGRAVLLLRPEEKEFIEYLKEAKVFLDKYETWDKFSNLQPKLNEALQDPDFHKMAVEAFQGYIRAFEVKKLKHVFNLLSMDMDAVARSFGLKEKPDVDIHQKTKKNQVVKEKQKTTEKRKNNIRRKQISKLFIATLNVRSLKSTERLIELEQAVEKINWDIIGICETRREEEYIKEIDNRYIHFNKGLGKGRNGVGFIVKMGLKNKVKQFIGISDRIAILVVKLPGYKKDWTIVQIYAPHELTNEQDKNLFYETLASTLVNIKYSNLIIMGDFNSQLGKFTEKEKGIMGPHSFGKRNENGNRLINFAFEFNLTITNTLFKKNKNRKWTWVSPDAKTYNEIDFILTNKPRVFKNVHVINTFNFNSDHRILRGIIKSTKKRHFIKLRNWEIPLSIPENVLEDFGEKLKTEIENNENEDIQKKYNILEKHLVELQDNLKYHKQRRNLGNETIKLLNIRKGLLLDRKNYNKEIQDISKKISESIRKHKKKISSVIIIEHIERTGSVKNAQKTLKLEKKWIPKLKNIKTGKYNTVRRNIIETATDFFKNLYQDQDQETETIYYQNETKREEEQIPLILPSEVEKAIKTQKDSNAPEEGNIDNKVIKGTMPKILTIITKIYNEIIETEQIPQQWTKSTITLRHKKGHTHLIENYMPINQMPNLYKIFSKIILSRITHKLNESQPREQAGFRKNFSSLDHIHVIKQLVEKCNEYNQPYYIGFVDYMKALDSIKHEYLWIALKEQGINNKYINIIKKIYKNITAKVKLERVGEEFQVNKGVRQGDPLSPKLFSAVLEQIFRKLDWDTQGININGRRLHHLRFSANLIITAEDPITLQKMFQDLAQESAVVGLKINTNETKIISNRAHEKIEVDQKVIEYVTEYTYLGQIISPKNMTDKEVEQRVASTWKRYWSLKGIMKNDEIPQRLKIKVFDICIKPCLTYGCQTWSIAQKNIQKLRVCQQGIERSMLKIKRRERVSLVKIRNRPTLENIEYSVKQLKWRWAGHTLRDNTGKWTKDIIEWYPRQGKRNRGRPLIRWEDDLKKVAGPLWRRTAQDVIQWNNLEKAYGGREPNTEED